MHPISDGSVQSRFANGFARTVELICPQCHEKSMFEAQPWQEHGGRIVATQLHCLRCENAVLLVQLLDD